MLIKLKTNFIVKKIFLDAKKIIDNYLNRRTSTCEH